MIDPTPEMRAEYEKKDSERKYRKRFTGVHPAESRHERGPLYGTVSLYCEACQKKTKHRLAFRHVDAHGVTEQYACLDCRTRECRSAAVDNELYVM
jgi:hypothetical protein